MLRAMHKGGLCVNARKNQLRVADLGDLGVLAATYGGGSAISDRDSEYFNPEALMRSILLYFLGIPIPIIILNALFVR